MHKHIGLYTTHMYIMIIYRWRDLYHLHIYVYVYSRKLSPEYTITQTDTLNDVGQGASIRYYNIILIIYTPFSGTLKTRINYSNNIIAV